MTDPLQWLLAFGSTQRDPLWTPSCNHGIRILYLDRYHRFRLRYDMADAARLQSGPWFRNGMQGDDSSGVRSRGSSSDVKR